MSIHSSGRNGSFSPPIIAHDVPRGLPEQGSSPGTVTASASPPPPTLLCTLVPGLGLWHSCALGFPLMQPPVGPEDGQQIPAEPLAWGRTGLRQVAVTVEELVESTVTGARDMPPTGMTQVLSHWRLMGSLLPPASSPGATSSTLHTALLRHAGAQPCMPHQCTLHLLLLLQQCGRATSSRFWQVLCSSSTC